LHPKHKEFAPEWEALTKSMKTMKAGHVNMDDADGKEFADLIGERAPSERRSDLHDMRDHKTKGASAEGIPNIKLFRYKDQFAAVPIMDGNSVRTTKKLRKILKKELSKHKKGENGMFQKTSGKAPEQHVVDTSDPNDPNFCWVSTALDIN
jgi:hypothetical protein